MSDAAEKLLEAMTGVSLSFTWMGVERKVSEQQAKEAAEQFQAHRDTVKIFKKIINTKNPFYRALTSVRSRIKSWWWGLTMPWIEAGTRLLKKTDTELFIDGFQKLQQDLRTARNDLEAHFPSVIAEGKEALGKLADDKDYQMNVQELFACCYDFVNLAPPPHLDPKRYEEVYRQRLQQMDKAVELFEQSMASELYKLVDHLRDKLTPGEDGNPKKFYASSVNNFLDFFGRFQNLNVHSNSELNNLVDQARGLVLGLDATDLKRDVGLQTQVRQGMEELASLMEASISLQPRRKLLRKKAPASTAEENSHAA